MQKQCIYLLFFFSNLIFTSSIRFVYVPDVTSPRPWYRVPHFASPRPTSPNSRPCSPPLPESPSQPYAGPELNFSLNIWFSLKSANTFDPFKFHFLIKLGYYKKKNWIRFQSWYLLNCVESSCCGFVFCRCCCCCVCTFFLWVGVTCIKIKSDSES